MVGYRIFLVITIPATYIFYVSLMELFSDSSTSIGRTADWREYIRFFFLARDTLETSAEARVEKSHGGTPIAPINKIFFTCLYFREAQIAADERAPRTARERELQLHTASDQRIPARRTHAAAKTGRIYNNPLRHCYLSVFITCHCLRRLFRTLY